MYPRKGDVQGPNKWFPGHSAPDENMAWQRVTRGHEVVRSVGSTVVVVVVVLSIVLFCLSLIYLTVPSLFLLSFALLFLSFPVWYWPHFLSCLVPTILVVLFPPLLWCSLPSSSVKSI